MGLQFGYGVRYGPLFNVGADINLLSHVQRSGDHNAYLTQSFGGSISLLGHGPSVETQRSVIHSSGCSISNKPFEDPAFSLAADTPLPGVGGSASRSGEDIVIGLGIKFIFGLELEWNVTETGRRLGGLIYEAAN